MKQIISIILIILLFISFSYQAAAQYISADDLYDTLYSLTESKMITAAIMAYFLRESEYRVNAVAGWYLLPNEKLCENFVEKIDKGLVDGSSREEFIYMSHFVYGGFGLGQWSSFYYLEGFYDLAFERQVSIADKQLQCDFVVMGLQQNEELWEWLINCTSAYECGRLVAIYYDGASEYGVKRISNFAQEIYDAIEVDS